MRERRALLLSGGQQKLVALARALAVGTRLLLLDEPFEGVAPALSKRLAEVIAGLQGQPRSSVLIAQSDLNHSRRLVDSRVRDRARRQRGSRGGVSAMAMNALARLSACRRMRARGAVRRPHGALLRRAARAACMRCSTRRAARARRRTTRWCAKAGAGAMPQLDAEVGRIAAGLAARGVARGDRVRAVHRQPARVRVRAAGRCSGWARSRCRWACASSARAGLHRCSQCGAIGDRRSTPPGRARARCRRGAGAARCASRSAARRLAPCDGLPRAQPRQPPAADAGRDRRRGDPLHLGHHRQPQGRDADPPEHRAFGAALPGLHAPRCRTTARRWRCRPAMSPG